MAETRPVYFPLGVADALGKTGFVSEPSGGILAIALDAGRVVWRTTLARQPLIAYGQWLATIRPDGEQPHGLRIVVLDVEDNTQSILVSEPVLLPDWIDVSTASEEVLSFDAHVTDGVSLKLRWKARAHYGGGAPPPAFVLERSVRAAAGIAIVDLRSGGVTVGPAEEACTAAPQLAETVEGSPIKLWSVGGRTAALLVDVANSEHHLRLRALDGRTVDLVHGTALVAEVTRDGAYVFVHRDQAEPGPWRFFLAESGNPLGSVTHVPGALQPCVIGDRFYCVVEGQAASGEQPTNLVARELATDRLRWELSLPGKTVSLAPPPAP